MSELEEAEVEREGVAPAGPREAATIDWLEVVQGDPRVITWLELEPRRHSVVGRARDPSSVRAHSAKVELLRQLPLFAGCSQGELAAVAPLVDELDVPRGETLIREGERGHEFFAIVEGSVGVTRSGRPLRELDSGDWAGEIALITDLPRTASVVTTSPVRLLVLGDRAFKALLEHAPSVGVRIMRPLAERLQATPA